MFHKNKKSNRLIFLTLVIILILVSFGALIYLEKTGKIDLYQKNKETATTTQNPINYDPPTQEEKTAGDNQKTKIVSSNKSNSPSDPKTTNSASVVVVDASQYTDVIEVRAFVSDHIEDGTCTFTFTKNNLKIVKTEPAYADASTTPCITLDVPKGEFKLSGTWSLVVDYISKSEGVSGTNSTTVEVAL